MTDFHNIVLIVFKGVDTAVSDLAVVGRVPQGSVFGPSSIFIIQITAV